MDAKDKINLNESSRSFANRVEEHSNQETTVIYIQSESKNYHYAKISHFKVVDQDSKQVTKEVIHIRINNLAFMHNTGKM